MPLSTSSSSDRLPHAGFGVPLFLAAIGLVAFASALELRLASSGFEPTFVDSEAAWLYERRRAAELGSDALILVGSSRMQLGIDMEVLRRGTGLEPVQLAVDGNSFLPVLRGLARDPRVSGTVVVGFEDAGIATPGANIVSTRYEHRYWTQRQESTLPDFEGSERWLSQATIRHMRSYADGGRPIDALLMRAMDPAASPQYMVTFPDRSRAADYSQVEMPEFYLHRVQRELGSDDASPNPPTATEAELTRRVALESPRDDGLYLQAIEAVMRDVRSLEARGGEVVFLVLPTSGLVRALEARRYPRPRFFDRFNAIAAGRARHFADIPAMRGFSCPDGSHLDRADRAAFTMAMIDAFGLSR